MTKKVPVKLTVNNKHVVKWVSPASAQLLHKLNQLLPQAMARAEQLSAEIDVMMLEEKSTNSSEK
jgi:hypothetical protein